jgi:hypothetical protein
MSYFPESKLIDQYGFRVENTPMGEMRVISPIRLVGTTFVGSTIDTNFWTATIFASGGTIATAVQGSGEIVLSSKTDSTGSVILQSVRKARYVGGSANRYRAQIQFGDTGKTDNTKRWGCFDGTDGAYFKLSGTTLSVCTLKASSETAVASASWNASTVTPTLTNVNTYEIYITNGRVYFVINDVLVHTIIASSVTWTATTNLPVRADNINSGNTTDTTMSIRVNTIYRLDHLETDSISKYVGTDTTTVLKYGAGRLHRIVNCDNVGSITLYDNTSAGGTIIATIDTSKVLGHMEFGCPFSLGLTLVTASSSKVVVVYE